MCGCAVLRAWVSNRRGVPCAPPEFSVGGWSNGGPSMHRSIRTTLVVFVALVAIATLPPVIAESQTRTNQTTGCEGNVVNYRPGNGEDIVVPKGFKVVLFSKIVLK